MCSVALCSVHRTFKQNQNWHHSRSDQTGGVQSSFWCVPREDMVHLADYFARRVSLVNKSNPFKTEAKNPNRWKIKEVKKSRSNFWKQRRLCCWRLQEAQPSWLSFLNIAHEKELTSRLGKSNCELWGTVCFYGLGHSPQPFRHLYVDLNFQSNSANSKE